MTGVPSDAAVASVKAPIAILTSDSLLNLILSIAPYHQINIDTASTGSTVSLSTKSTTSDLTQRNAILRKICGMIFHNALDKHPYYLLGGHSASGQASTESALCLASISSYMSIASSIRSRDVELTKACQHLNQVLADNSFLVGSTPRATLGDLDVFFALSEVSGGKINNINKLVHFKRWIKSVYANVEDLISLSSKRSNWPEISLPVLDFTTVAEPSPVFYYGDEDGIDAVLTSSPMTEALTKKSNNGAVAGQNSGGKELTEEQKKAAAEKRAKKNAEKEKKKKAQQTTVQTAPASAEIDASAFDIRVGKIIEVWEHAESEKLWCEKIDLGDGTEPRQILSGLRKFYTKEEMQDRMVLVLCNLKKRNLVGVPSHGMVLCASNAEHTEVEFVIPPTGAKIGERVMFDGYNGDAAAENAFAKKKMLEKLAPDLKTDDSGVVVWKGAKSVTSAGPCIASKGMAGAQVS